MAKPAGFAAQSVASSSEPVATPSSALALLVPQVQQTRNVSPWGLLLMWAALPGPQRELRMQEEQPRVSSAWLEGLQHRWGRWQNHFISSAGESCDVSLSLCAWAAQVPWSINPLTNTQIHGFGYIYTYIHTYTRFPVKSNKSISLCVWTYHTCLQTWEKKGCLFFMNMDPFLFCEHVRSKKKNSF